MFGSGFFMGAAMLASLHGEVVTAKGQLPDLELTVGDDVYVDLSGEFANTAEFSLAPNSAPLPAGLVLDGAAIHGAPIEASNITIIVVRGRNLISYADSGFEIAVAEPAPALTDGSGPAILGQAEVGRTIDVEPGTWAHADSVNTELLVNGVPRDMPCVLQPSDDGATIHVRDTATGPSGTTTATSVAQIITYPTPSISGSLPNVSAAIGDANPTHDAGALLSGAGGTWTVTGPGATIDEAGIVIIATTATINGTVTATYTNSGGAASVSFTAVVTQAQGPVAWTPNDLPSDINFALYTFRASDVTVNGSNEITGIIPRYNRGGNPATTFGVSDPDISGPAPWDAANEALDLNGADCVMKVDLPFTMNAQGATDSAAVAIAGTGMTGEPGVWAHNPDNDGTNGTDGRLLLTNRGLARNSTSGFVTGYPQAGATIYYADVNSPGTGQRTNVRYNGIRGDEAAFDGASRGSINDGFVIGPCPDGTGGMPGKVRMIALFDRKLPADEQRYFDSWAKHNLSGMGGITLYDHTDGEAVTLSAHNDSEYLLGSPPLATGASLDLGPLYEGVAIEPFPLSNLFAFADGYTVTGLPTGLSASNGVLTGTPTMAGTFPSVQITATNAAHSTLRTFSLTVQAVPATATDADELMAMALNGAPDDTMTVDNLGGVIDDPALLIASTLTDAGRSLKLIGATDFRVSTVPTTNLDTAFSTYIPHTDAAGAAINSPPSEAAHPIYQPDLEPRQFRVGPEDPLNAPMDHMDVGGVWVPAGLKLFDDAVTHRGTVDVRHQLEHDGHVLWAMKVRRLDGTVETVFEERRNSRGSNPAVPWRAALHGSNPATHLLALATFQISSFTDNQVNLITDSADPTTWILPGKRRRGDYSVDDTAADWAEVNTIIEGLPVTGGLIDGKAADAPYVIQLPPIVLKNSSNDASATFTPAAIAKMQAITQNRLFLVGVPGKTILPYPVLNPGVDVDFGWITVTREITEAYASGDNRDHMLLVHNGARVRFFGSVIDGVDGTFDLRGAADTDTVGKPSVFEFYDGVITGVVNGAGVGRAGLAGTTDEATFDASVARIAIARSILDHGNDDFPAYGAVSARFEGNYFLGGGGIHFRDGGVLHRDIGAQTDGKAAGTVNLVQYDNIFHSGPAMASEELNRAEETLYMLQGARMDVLDLVGNVWVTHGQAIINRAGNDRRPAGATMEAPADWLYGATISGNLMLPYAPAMSPGVSYPDMTPNIITGEVEMQDARGGANNLVSMVDLEQPDGFARVINFLPEEMADINRTAWPDAATAFASLPTFAGTAAEGYTADWSGTAYAGTSREGYIAPADFAAATELQTWGPGGGPSVRQHGAYLSNFLDLPSDVYQHLGYVNAGGVTLADGLYTSDWFGTEPPAEFALSGTQVDPWTAPPGLAEVEPKSILLNAMLGSEVGSGSIFEEVDADGSLHRLEILASGKVRWTVYDTDGLTALYRVTTNTVAQANSHIFGILTTRFINWASEAINHRTAVRRMIFEHYERDAQTDELVHVYTAQPTAPTAETGGAGVALAHFWADTSNNNVIYVWDGVAWVLVQGELADIASNRFAWMAGKLPGGVLAASPWNQYLHRHTLPATTRRIVFKPTQPADMGVFSPAYASVAIGDHVWFAREGAGLNYGTGKTFELSASGWTDDGNIAPNNEATRTPTTRSVRGQRPGSIRIDGQEAMMETDWLSANSQNPADTTGFDRILPRGEVRLGADTANPYTQNVRFLEARRFEGVGTWGVGNAEPNGNGLWWRMARGPVSAATGERDHPFFGPADVWITTAAVVAPVNTLAPIINGTFTEGHTLSVSTGTWDNGVDSYAYQWTRNGSNIVGATTNTYTLLGADVGTVLDCAVTATSAGGSTSISATGEATVTSAGAPLPLIIDATRTSIVAGEGVHLAVNFGAGWPADALLDATVKWDFDDPGSTFDHHPVGSKANTDANKAVGISTAKVWLTPGSKTVTVTARDRLGNYGQTTQTIMVADPDMVYAGAATATLGSDPGDDYADIVAAFAWLAGADNRRLLLRRGDTFATTDALRLETTGFYLGSFGTGARPIVDHSEADFYAILEYWAGDHGYVGDIEFRGQYSPTDLNIYTPSAPHYGAGSSAILVKTASANNLTMNNIKVSGLGLAISIQKNVILNNSDVSNWNVSGFYAQQFDRVALIGSKLAQDPAAATTHTTTGAGTNNGLWPNHPRGGPTRLVFGDEAVVQSCHLESWYGSSPAADGTSAHQPPMRVFTASTGNNPDNKYRGSISLNHTVGGWNQVAINVQNSVTQAALPIAIVTEQNYFEATAYTISGMNTGYSNHTVRNNVIYVPPGAPHSSAENTDFTIFRAGYVDGLSSAANLAGEIKYYQNTAIIERDNAIRNVSEVTSVNFGDVTGSITLNSSNNLVQVTGNWANREDWSTQLPLSADHEPQTGSAALGGLDRELGHSVSDYAGNDRWPYQSRGARRPASAPSLTDTVLVTVEDDNPALTVGTTLTVTETRVIATQTGAVTGYQWKRDGAAIPGATSAVYTTAQIGDHSCEVTATLQDSSTTTGESAAVTISAFTPSTIQFRDSVVMTNNLFDPAATNKGTIAYRMTLIDQGNNGDRFMSNTFGQRVQSTGRIRFDQPQISTTPTIDFIGTPASVLLVYDGDGGLAGGKTSVIWAKIGSDPWGEIGSSTTTFATLYKPLNTFGSFWSDSTGPNFDLEHWLWCTDTAIDPSTRYTDFFNADGTVKDLGADGTAGGALPTPKLYMQAADFVTPTNRGTGGAVSTGRAAIVVVAP